MTECVSLFVNNNFNLNQIKTPNKSEINESLATNHIHILYSIATGRKNTVVSVIMHMTESSFTHNVMKDVFDLEFDAAPDIGFNFQYQYSQQYLILLGRRAD